MAKLTRWAVFLRVFLLVLLAGQPGRAVAASAAEENAWRAAQSQNTAAGYYRYLARYPTGEYVSSAIAALARLGAMGQAAPGRQVPSVNGGRGPNQY